MNEKLKSELTELMSSTDEVITYFHEMNPRPDYGVRNGTVHSILATLDTLKTLLEMLYEQL